MHSGGVLCEVCGAGASYQALEATCQTSALSCVFFSLYFHMLVLWKTVKMDTRDATYFFGSVCTRSSMSSSCLMCCTSCKMLASVHVVLVLMLVLLYQGCKSFLTQTCPCSFVRSFTGSCLHRTFFSIALLCKRYGHSTDTA